MKTEQRDPQNSEDLRYSILDPTGNITALVESRVETERQPSVAAELMRRHPEVEQVGFVVFSDSLSDPVQVELRMAGGEFCGNATMSAAALFFLRRGEKPGEEGRDAGTEESPVRIRLLVSGAAQPVEVRLWREEEKCFRAGVRMPKILEVQEQEFVFGDSSGKLPCVRMEGISHIVIEEDSVFFRLLERRSAAEQAVQAWCSVLSAEGLGLMFLEKGEAGYRLTPLVWIPGSRTLFWENSCASGSAATGRYLAEKTGMPVSAEMRQPSGVLRVESDPETGDTWLYGRTRLTK